MNNATYFSKSGIAALLSVVKTVFPYLNGWPADQDTLHHLSALSPVTGYLKYHHP
jgi:hypothetical protein